MRKIDSAGVRYGKLTGICQVESVKKRTMWKFRCDCGNEKVLQAKHVRDGRTTSCGCDTKEKRQAIIARNPVMMSGQGFRSHGLSKTPTYFIWKSMKARCYRQTDKDFHHYGGQGVKVCDAWRKSFMAFYLDMGEAPEGLTLDRINPFGDYEPGNCRWATWSEQNLNKRSKYAGNPVA